MICENCDECILQLELHVQTNMTESEKSMQCFIHLVCIATCRCMAGFQVVYNHEEQLAVRIACMHVHIPSLLHLTKSRKTLYVYSHVYFCHFQAVP